MVKKRESKQYKRLTLQSLFADGSEVWVKNCYHKVTGKEPANVVMEVRNGAMVDVVVVPPGNDPVCLSDQVVPKLLSECMDLYKLVRSEILEVLDPEFAEDYYLENKGRKDAMANKISAILDHGKGNKRNELRKKNPPVSKSQLGHTDVNTKVGDICLKARHAALTEQQAMERLLEQEEILNINDYNYLVANGVFPKIQDWARDQSNRLIQEG